MQDNNLTTPVTPEVPTETPLSETPLSETPPTEAPQKKFPVIPIVIGSVIAIVIAFGATVAVLVAVNKEEVKISETSSTEKTDKSTEEKPVEEEPVEEEPVEKEPAKEEEPSKGSGGGSIGALQRSQRNTQRADDLARLLTAINNYQANNNGKLPFADGGVQSKFVSRYIDRECSTEDGLTYKGCGDEFKDPDGTIYGFTKPIELSQAKKNALSNVEKMDHKFHPYVYAVCGDENEVLLGTGKRDVAILMKLEGGAVACNDNH